MVTRVLIPTMNSLLESLNISYNLNKSDGYYTLNLGGIDKTIWLLSSENYQRAAGISASYFLMDEADLMKKDVGIAAFNMLVSRLTRGNQIQGILVSTPEGFNTCYSLFEENKGDDRRLIRASTRSNPFIDESYIQNMRKTHTEQQLKAYLDGYFVNLTTGNVYYAFDRKVHHTDKTIADYPNHILHIGADFNVGKCYCPISVIDNGIAYTLDEISGGKNTEHMIEMLINKYPNRQMMIYPDASGGNSHTSTSASDIQLLSKIGEIQAPRKNPFIKDRVNAVNAKFKNANGNVTAYVNTTLCKALTKTLEQQGYDSNGSPDKSSDLDHPGDAYGYFINYRFGLINKFGQVSTY